MIKSFGDSETEKIWRGKKSSKLPPEIHKDERFDLPTVGEILAQEFLEPLNISAYKLSKDLGVSSSSILDLVHGKRKITVEMSLRLSKYFGTTSKFWLNMQNELDLREAEIKLEKDLEKIPRYKIA